MAEVDCRYMGSLQSYTITYPNPDESPILDPPEALPTSEPATAQIEYTIAAGHLPTVSPAGLAYTLAALLYAAGQNTDAASRTVYYRILKNGVSVATGSYSVSAGQFYTWTHSNFLGVVAGDVLSCKLWASSANVNWRYKALVVFPTRFANAKRQAVMAVSLSVAAYPILTGGTPFMQNIGSLYTYSDSERFYSTVSSAKSYALLVLAPTYGLARAGTGDFYQESYCSTHATYCPYYRCNWLPTAISFRPLNLRV